MGISNPRAFSEWLRAQLRAKKMSQRQLAQQSGIDHSTISRLVRGDRMPSLGTALALARGLRELGDIEDDGAGYLAIIAAGNRNPAARVEYALRADEFLADGDVRLLMDHYLALRARRVARAQGLAAVPPAVGAMSSATSVGATRPGPYVRPAPVGAVRQPVAMGGERAESRTLRPPDGRGRY
jgi:transcriptional regulator with XRE-family HTH domain